MREEKIDYLEIAVTKYLFQIMRQELNPGESAEVFSLLNMVKDQEALGDVIEVRMLQLLRTKESLGTELSREGEEEIRSLHGHVCNCMSRLTESIESTDGLKAVKILEQIKEFEQLERQTEHHHLQRIQQMISVSEQSHDLHMELIDALKQILFYCKEIIKNFLASQDNI